MPFSKQVPFLFYPTPSDRGDEFRPEEVLR